jgi:hypothetical protein
MKKILSKYYWLLFVLPYFIIRTYKGYRQGNDDFEFYFAFSIILIVAGIYRIYEDRKDMKDS